MPQVGLFDTGLFFVENSNHVWRDLFRLVDVESIEIAGNSSIFQVEHASSWTFFVESRNHVWRDLFLLVDVESIEIAGNSSIFQVEHAPCNTPSATQDCVCGEQEPCVEGSLQVS